MPLDTEVLRLERCRYRVVNRIIFRTATFTQSQLGRINVTWPSLSHCPKKENLLCLAHMPAVTLSISPFKIPAKIMVLNRIGRIRWSVGDIRRRFDLPGKVFELQHPLAIGTRIRGKGKGKTSVIWKASYMIPLSPTIC